MRKGLFIITLLMTALIMAGTANAQQEKKILYYKCPMGQPDFSKTPGKAKCGMDYVPVYEDKAAESTKARGKAGSDLMMKGEKEEVAAEAFNIKLRILTMDELMKLPAEELEGMKMDHSKSHHIGIEVYDSETEKQVSDAEVQLTVFDPSKKKINIGTNPMARHYCEDIDLVKKGLYQFEILVKKGKMRDTAWFEYLAE
ncbi:MAG: hypothetical protein OEV28_01535 [Nitrospirota bacterium]|nr:hypothetical protein [Nitrospirota bacterium]